MDTNSGYIHTEYYSALRKDSSHLQKHGGALSTLCGDKSDKDTVWSHVESKNIKLIKINKIVVARRWSLEGQD